jgi:4-hydroxy-2-oxoglutarate aldolase
VIDLKGVFAPTVTVFDPVTGEVDVVAFRRNARAWLQAPLSGLVLFGSTGEGPLLDEDERTQLLASVRELAEDRLLLAGTGAESTRATVRLTRAAAAAGADAVLVHPPAYFKPQMTPEVLRDHYIAVADAAPVPVILYQIPPRFSGVELSAGLVGELARHPNIVGIKDSSGDLKTLGAFADACHRGCTVLVGNGAMLFSALEVGAGGGILALALLAPHECAEVFRLREAGDVAAAGRLQERIAPVHRAIVGGLGVAGVKAALDYLGMAGGVPRSPLKPLREKDRQVVRTTLEEAGLLPGSLAAGTA